MKDIKTALFETMKAAEQMADGTLSYLREIGKDNDPFCPEFKAYERDLNAVNALKCVARESGVLDEYEAWKEQN